VSLVDLIAIFCMALAVFLPKAVPMLLVSDHLTPGIRRWLDYVAPAVLAALVAPSLVIPDGSFGPPRLEQLAFVVTFAVAVVTRRMLPSIVAGMAVLIGVVIVGPNG
jgi:branched-subunit amino acid transport protein